MGHVADIDTPRAYPRLGCGARFKQVPDDFRVTEVLRFAPGAVGEHLYLQIEKVATETLEIAQRLAEFYSVTLADIGFAGFKDTQAVATQWFSIRTPSDLAPAPSAQWRVVGRGRNAKKLRRGQHAGNQFCLRLREVVGTGWEERLAAVAVGGVPNYFGPQRFTAGAVERASAWLQRRQACRAGSRGGVGWYLSVLRSHLFNQVVGRRVQAANWHRLIDGDVPACAGARYRVPTGPLWGRGRSPAAGLAREVERDALAEHHELCHGLEFTGLQQDRRALVLLPQNLRWRAADSDLELSFALPRGGYATSVLREIFVLKGSAGGV